MSQMGQIRKRGPIGKVMGMIPGMGELTKQMNMSDGAVDSQMGHMQAIYNSMNRKERKNPDLLDAGRRRRISQGSGVALNEIGQFIKQFEMMRDMMRAVGGMGMMGKFKLMKGLMSGKLNTLGMPGGPMLKTKKSGFMEKKDRNKKKKR
jgi:signal recognition particle subunit SRP54